MKVKTLKKYQKANTHQTLVLKKTFWHLRVEQAKTRIVKLILTAL